jgi:hypothetical protein
MITVQIQTPKPKLRVFKCDGIDVCSGDGVHWVLDAGRIAYDAPTWADAMDLATSLIRQDRRRRASALEPTC